MGDDMTRLHFQLRQHEKDTISKAASRAGLQVGPWVRMVALREARESDAWNREVTE